MQFLQQSTGSSKAKKEFTRFASVGEFGDALANTHIEISVPLFLPRVQEGQD